MQTTDKMPFSNGTEFIAWQEKNCDLCELYESQSTERNKAKCKYAFDLDIAPASGKIPISTIDYFGFKKGLHLANCPRLHCGRIKGYADYLKAVELAAEKKKTELQF